VGYGDITAISAIEKIVAVFQIEKTLYNNLAKSIRYDQLKKSKDLSQFMNELPYKLKIELAFFINKKLISEITFFKDKND